MLSLKERRKLLKENREMKEEIESLKVISEGDYQTKGLNEEYEGFEIAILNNINGNLSIKISDDGNNIFSTDSIISYDGVDNKIANKVMVKVKSLIDIVIDSYDNIDIEMDRFLKSL